MRGTIPLMKLITKTKELHMSHIALTEVNGLWGFIRFVQLAKEQGIKAIAGTNLITTMDNVVLLAENQTGTKTCAGSFLVFTMTQMHQFQTCSYHSTVDYSS